MDETLNALGYKVAYAPWETYNMEPEILRFRHEFEGHRHLAVGGIGGGGAFGGGEGTAAGGGVGAGAPSAAGPAGVGAVGAIFAAQPAPLAPPASTLVIAPQPLAPPSSSLVIPSQPQNPLVVSATMGQRGGGTIPPPSSPLTIAGQRGGGPDTTGITIGQSGGRPLTLSEQRGIVPHLSTEDREGCTTCGGIRAQQDELRASIKAEQEQLAQQRLSRQESQIQQYKTAEQSGQQFTDQQLTQQIQDKIALLQQLNDELAQAQSETGVAPSPPAGLPPSAPSSLTAWQRLQDLVREAEQYASDLPSRVVEGLIHEAFPFLADRIAKTLADAIAVLTPPGMVQKLNQLRDQYLGRTPAASGTPSVTTPPPPPAPPKAIRMCMICESAEDAVRWQAGEPTPGCAVESVREANPEDFANRG